MENPHKKRTGKSELGYKFISLFERMPGNVYCPQFYILHHAVGCPYRCSYCFLQNTLRGNTSPRWYDNLDVMQKEVDDWLQKTEKPSLLNTGELADSFAVSTAYLSHVIPLFTAQNKHVLSFLTKGDSWPDEIPVHPNLRLGWSINAAQISATYEHLAPSSTARLAAAARAKTAGYNVRIRLDPIIPIEGWETMYVQTVQDIIAIKPDFVTLRTLRAQGNLPSYASRGHAVETANPFMTVGHLMVRDGDDKALRINPDLRMEIYEKLGKLLTDAGIAWGLCKETTAVLQRLNKVNHFCNCLP